MSHENECDLVLCSWCDRPKPLQLCLSGTLPHQTFCSEKCFILSRRASFKRNRASKEHRDSNKCAHTEKSSSEPSSSIEDKADLVTVKTENIDHYELSTSESELLTKPVSSSPAVSLQIPAQQPAVPQPPPFFMNPPFITPTTITKTIPIFVPLPIPIPLPIFKNAPELLSILTRYGYRPRGNRRHHHRRPRPRHRIYSSKVNTNTVFVDDAPQEVALDLRLRPTEESDSGTPLVNSVISEIDPTSHYSARRRRILDASPVTPVPDKVGYVDRYRAASAIRLKRLRKSKNFRVISTTKNPL